jgi:multidrug resistance efflux pump
MLGMVLTLCRPAPAGTVRRQLRATGTTRALKQLVILTPQITGQSARLTLTRLVPSGTRVQQGDLLAEFDKTQQLDTALEAQAKYDDFGHQVEQKRAENRANAEKRAVEMQQALADLAKADIQRRKGPVLGEIERLKNEVKLADAKAHVESLKKSQQARETADAAALRILELKQQRQKVILERTRLNVERLVVKAPHEGVVALENTWRSGSMGPPQEGDQMSPGQPLLRVFDPKEMEIHTMVGEPDGAVLTPGVKALVRLDAYPDLVFEARLVAASPVAASAIGLPIKKFAARFRLEKSDPRVLPDLSAAVIILGAE